MHRWGKARLVWFALFTLTAATGIAALQSPKREPQRKKVEFPVADYNAPEPADPQERARRKKKGEKYNNAPMRIDPSLERAEQVTVEHFPADTPALPAAQSAAVVLGTITRAHAHLSPDKGYVYTEYDVLVDEVLKADPEAPITAGATLPVERPGGRVRVPSGQIHHYRTNRNPLEVGGRYALFLVLRGGDYMVFTGYKIEAGKVFAVDDYFKPYDGTSEEDLMRDLRQAAASPPGKERSAVDDTSTPDVTATLGGEPTDPTDPGGGGCQLPSPPPCITPRNDQIPKFSRGTVRVTYNPDHFSAERVRAIQNGYMVWNGLGGVTFTTPIPSRTRPANGSGNTLHFESADQPTAFDGTPRDARVSYSGPCANNVCSYA